MVSDGSRKLALNFQEQCKRYYNDLELNIPTDKPHKLVFRRCAPINDGVQRPIPERSKNTKFGTNLINLNSVMSKVPKNLGYHKPLESWFQFYEFPNKQRANVYKEEIRQSNPTLKKFSVANTGLNSIKEYADRIIDLNNREHCGINFLQGTTGVGKTTFFKFFVKTQKPLFLSKNNIISRVKFDDVEKSYNANKNSPGYSLQKAFSQIIIDRIFRDLIDSYIMIDEIRNMPMSRRNTFQFNHNYILPEINEQIRTDLKGVYNETIRHLKEDKVLGFKVSEIVEKLNTRDVAFLNETSKEHRRKVIGDLKEKGFKFCIVLDGFDALRPEDIILFESQDQADFCDCLGSAIKNSIDIGARNGELINSLDKVFIVASRPVTIVQLRKELNPEIDFDVLFEKSTPTFAIGSDIFGILKNRIKVRFSERNYIQPPNSLFDGLESGINGIIELIYENHDVEPGRFIDLFNHNIREKLVFLKNVIDFLIIKIENAFYEFNKTNNLDLSSELEYSMFRRFSRRKAKDLNISLYEVQKLLILQSDGIYKNKFDFDLTGSKLIYRTEAGPFENIFNYLPLEYREMGYFAKEYEPGTLPTKYDPILVKLQIMNFLSEEAAHNNPIPLAVVQVWLKKTFTKHQLENCDLQTLIRSDLVNVSLNGDEALLNCTRKGLFVLREMTKCTIYIEHVILRSFIPFYVQQNIEVPRESSPGMWAQISMINMIVFFQYLRSVAIEMDKKSSSHLTKWVDDTFTTLSSHFSNIAAQGLEYNIDYSLNASKRLAKFTNFNHFVSRSKPK